MKRPVLIPANLPDWLWAIGEPYPVAVLVNEGAWNDHIKKAYQQGGVVIEFAEHKPVRAFRREPA